MPLVSLALLVAGLSAGSGAPPAAQAGPRRVELLVPMRDGVELAARVLLPESGRHPAILMRTPYGRAEALESFGAERLAGRGYAVVAQDVRGKGESGGEFQP